MLQSEFEARTGYRPTPQEFEEIEALYMATDDDKDTFCMKWKRANRELVAWQKKAKKAVDETVKELYSQLSRLESEVKTRLMDPLLNFHNARHAALCKAEQERDKTERLIVFLVH